LVVGDEPTSGPRPWAVDQVAMASAVGVRTYTVGRVDAAAATVTAIEHALAYRVPVVLAIPYDVATLDIGDIPAAPGPGSAARPPHRRTRRGEAAGAPGRPWCLAVRCAGRTRRSRHGHRCADSDLGAGTQCLPRTRIRPRRGRGLRCTGGDGADPAGGCGRGLRRLPQPVHDALRRPVPSGHLGVADRHR